MMSATAHEERGSAMQAKGEERRPGGKGRAARAVRRTVQASIKQVMREMAAAGEVPYTTAIARRLGKDPANVSREIRALRARGRVVKGKRQGAIVPYYLRERG